jgi:hypothetical protein
MAQHGIALMDDQWLRVAMADALEMGAISTAQRLQTELEFRQRLRIQRDWVNVLDNLGAGTMVLVPQMKEA